MTNNSWSLIVDRMMHFTGTAIAVRNRPMNAVDAEYTMMVEFPDSCRGPAWNGDTSYRVFPRPYGTIHSSCGHRITELPQQLLALHDVAPGNDGTIWFTSHKTR